jgi:hypothetical protein
VRNTSSRRHTALSRVVPVLSLLGVALPAQAQEPAAADSGAARVQERTDGDRIVARFQEALGGLAAFEAVQSLHGTGDLLIPAAGIGGSVEIWQARPNRSVMHVALSGYGEVRTGYTGTTGWTVSTVEGPRLMTGEEALQAADDAWFDSLLRTNELVDSLIFVERTTLAGRACDQVRVVWRTGRVTRDCFDTDSGLLVGSVRSQLTGPLAAEATILYDDYREFGAIRIPTKITTRVGGIDQVITLLDVELNVVGDDVFQPPPPIRELIRG